MKYILFLVVCLFCFSVKASEIEVAQDIIKQNKASLVILKNGKIIDKAYGRGVSPLLVLYDEKPNMLRDAVLVDKVIGKAVAFIAINAGIKSVYGQVMSVEAEKVLKMHNISSTYSSLVPKILNRNKDGECPIELVVKNIDDKDEALKIIRNRLKELRKTSK